MQVTFDPTNPRECSIVAAIVVGMKAGESKDVPQPGTARFAEQQADLTPPAAEKPKKAPKAETPAPAPVAAPVTEPTPAPAPAPEAAPAAPAATIDDARKALIAVGDKLGPKLGADNARGEVIKLLAEVGAKTIKEVKADDFAKLVARSRAVLTEHGVA
jgi:cell wall-associated NlpC family hydrolase